MRDFVSLQLLAHGLGDLVDDVRLVASELATNAIRHARTSFTVSLEETERRVVLTVQDGCATPPHVTDGPPLALGGRGLHIVELLSSEWGVATTSGGAKSVWAGFGTGA